MEKPRIRFKNVGPGPTTSCLRLLEEFLQSLQGSSLLILFLTLFGYSKDIHI